MFEDSFTKIFSIQRRPQRQASPSQQTTQSHRSRVGQSPEYILKRVCPNQELDQDEVVEQERIIYSETHDLPSPQVVTLYKANGWSAANKPQRLLDALKNSHSLISAWDGETLVGLGSAISDGHLVVYYPHLLVLPQYQGRGIGQEIMRLLLAKYEGFHMHMLTADAHSIGFYEKCGFERAGQTKPMWIYSGQEH
jgi:GNAT superfamily N-acetyltransferase